MGYNSAYVCLCMHSLSVCGREAEREREIERGSVVPSHIFLMNELKIINSLPDAADVASTAYADKCSQGHGQGGRERG